jgi:ubiquinone/menaquinone biosynthesis C-methylase UbiE
MLKNHYKEVFEKQDSHWWYMGMRDINVVLLGKYLLRKRKLKILDAGCGPGAMLPTLANYGEVVGVDLSDDALKFAKKRGKVLKGDITKLKFKDKTFDLVICMDVLYHTWVGDESTALKEFNRVLKKDGTLLIREPAFNWLRGNQDKIGLTSRRFSKKSLSKKVTAYSFEIQKITYANFFLFPAVVLIRLLGMVGKNRIRLRVIWMIYHQL